MKLKICNPQIKDSLHQNKTAHKIWKDEGRPNDLEYSSVRMKKETRKIFRSEIRKEENKRKQTERDRIITANTQDKRLFYQLIKKQRNNKNILINDLHAANKKYEHEEISFAEETITITKRIHPNTSPFNAAVIFEEVDRQYSDKNSPFYITLLGAKSAFDVVLINMLMRKLFLLDIDPATWSLIDDLHLNTSCNIKWKNQLSKKFKVHQGVKQGGLLSADLYKLYIEDLLSLYERSAQGCKIGHININAVACAVDIAVWIDKPYDLQILVNHALQYSQLHHYTLQPQKSVIIQHVQHDNRHQIAINVRLHEN
ncbi:unnamed protein product [Mytilus coruscus]|uniref:Reverse transcriptase domain-containing protein n=1 Tax=Mytilus coruscus TaxID=42192 RepID=A0A6J8BC35_MYTCO|nr:unnamed protein product [Mytilus coruscus]